MHRSNKLLTFQYDAMSFECSFFYVVPALFWCPPPPPGPPVHALLLTTLTLSASPRSQQHVHGEGHQMLRRQGQKRQRMEEPEKVIKPKAMPKPETEYSAYSDYNDDNDYNNQEGSESKWWEGKWSETTTWKSETEEHWRSRW